MAALGRWRAAASTGLPGAALAFAAWAWFRLGLQSSLEDRGEPGGMLAYDSYYPLAFARELEREGSWLLFQNPFGTLDDSAGLFNGLALALRAAAPLWQGDLLAFDLVVGAITAVAAGWLFARIAFRVSRQPATVTHVAVALVILGGGIGFVAADLGLAGDDRYGGLVWGGLWGLSWFTNQLATWELLYHALFWAGTLAMVTGRNRGAVAVGAILAAVHPFTFGVYVLLAVSCWGAQAARGAPGAGPLLRGTAAPLAGLALAAGLAYEVLLPAVSADAEFLRTAYNDQPFAVPTGYVLLYAAPALLLLALLLVGGRGAPDRGAGRGDDRRDWALGFLLCAALLFALGASYHVTEIVPQPAHWTRVYLVALVAAGALGVAPAARAARPVLAVALVLAAVAVADSLAARSWLRDDVIRTGPPALLDRDERRLVAVLDGEDGRAVYYVRRCGNFRSFPGLEFSLAALTDHQPPFGHVFFSPDIERRSAGYFACGGPPRGPLPPGSRVVADTGIGARLRLERLTRVGRFDVGFMPGTSSTAG